MTIVPERLETLIVARAYALRAPTSGGELIKVLARYCPADQMPGAWATELAHVVDRLRGKVLRDDCQLVERDELERRLGAHTVTTWPQLADRVLPGLGLGIVPNDAKALHKLTSRDAWAAAIIGRVRGIWIEGAPPSLSAVCDAIAWKSLGLAGKAKRLPAEVRGLFLQQQLETTSAPPDRLVRQLAARELGVPRADARALRDGLVRAWLAGRSLAPNAARDFVQEVNAITRTARDGVFGDRKVFISSVWDRLRREPVWSTLTLDEFKSRLLAAHRTGAVVLARADLVAAMNPALVAASETVTDGASFHFVVREPV